MLFATKSRWLALATLTIAAACSDVEPTTPTTRSLRPLLNVSADPGVRSYCNPTVFRLPAPANTDGQGPAEAFPSTVEVTGAPTSGFKVTVTINALTHTFAADLDMVLVSPSGTQVMLMSDAGSGFDFMSTKVTFDDAAVAAITEPASGAVFPSGSYRPTYVSIGNDTLPGGPSGPYEDALSSFGGADPNGMWQLYVWDDGLSDIGAVGDNGAGESGWCVNITTSNAPPAANAGGPYAAAEGSAITFDGTASSDPDNEIVSYAWDFGDGNTGTGPTPTHTYADNLAADGAYTVTLTVTTNDGATSTATTTVTVSNVAPQVTGVTLYPTPVAVGTPIEISATFTDVGSVDTHTALWDLGPSGTVVSGTVVEGGGSGIATATVVYSAPGVYTITASVTDDDVATGTRSSALSLPAYIVVYDPTTGYVTGGGWINSPAGAYTANPAQTGQATFGFVAKYLTGSSVPTGNTQFHFRVGDLRFSSTRYDYLVVASAKAKYKGEGTINGVGGYGFMLTAGDGDAKEPPGPDSFRIRIWNVATGAIVYDNVQGASEDSYASATIAGGSVTVHK